ncbi:MAG: glycosyltransferase family 9 protein [Anaerolineae bacterium]
MPTPSIAPSRIVLILPCCIGDVVLATATLAALRRAYPAAHITWAVGTWSKGVVENHPLLNAVLDTGPSALPVKSIGGFLQTIRQLRAEHFDLVVSLVRSPLMSAAVLLSGIPVRAGLDSAGRGFGYNVRARINPDQPRHEAEIYLDVARALGLDVTDCVANVPVLQSDAVTVAQLRTDLNINRPYIVIHPGGGRNPGMVMDSKRWPPAHFAALADRLAARYHAQIVLIGAAGDKPLLDAVASTMKSPATSLIGRLSFGQIAALAQPSLLYLGNDTGMTHLAAAAGVPTVMILGPSDPARYAPFTSNSRALWKPTTVDRRGVSGGAALGWDWQRDGLCVEEAEMGIMEFLAQFGS